MGQAEWIQKALEGVLKNGDKGKTKLMFTMFTGLARKVFCGEDVDVLGFITPYSWLFVVSCTI